VFFLFCFFCFLVSPGNDWAFGHPGAMGTGFPGSII